MTVPATKHQLSLFFHTHWDREWYESYASYQFRLIRTVDSILALIQDKTLPVFTLDGQTVLLDDYLAIRQSKKQQSKNWLKKRNCLLAPGLLCQTSFWSQGKV